MEKRYSDQLKVALVEFSPEWEQPARNLAALEAVFSDIYSGTLPFGPDLVVLPEFFAAGFTMDPLMAEDTDNGMTLAWMKRMSAAYSCALAGSVPVKTCDGVRYNRMFFVSPPGVSGETEVDFYDKSRLFFGGEDINYTRGGGRKVFEFKGWRIMPGICFDIRFPELSRNCPDSPYDLYVNVANWPVARNAAADILLKARSIENACWSVFCNRTGSDPLLEYSGNSAVIDYRGRSRGHRCVAGGVPVVYGVLEKAPMMRFRDGFPVLDSAPRL